MAKEFKKIINRGLYLALPKYSLTTFVRGYDQSWRRFYHRGTGPDRGVIKQIFFKQDYLLERLARKDEIYAVYEHFISHHHTPMIIDCGANIGASAVWFHNLFPRSHILAIEPDEDNCAYLRRNTEGIDIDMRCAAISSENGFAQIINQHEGTWAYRTEIAQHSTLPRLSLSELIKNKKQENYKPFIVKIDIEGAEQDVFSQHSDWIDDVPLLIIELHDWMLPKAGTARAFLSAIAGRDRDFVSIGENIFSIRNA
jgi:FkbM family methyltransferase